MDGTRNEQKILVGKPSKKKVSDQSLCCRVRVKFITNSQDCGWSGFNRLRAATNRELCKTSDSEIIGSITSKKFDSPTDY